VRTVPRLCEECPGVCLTTEEKARKNHSRGRQRVPAGTMKTEYTERNTHCYPKNVENKNKHTRKIVHQVGFYLQEYTRIDGQQNIKITIQFCNKLSTGFFEIHLSYTQPVYKMY
jgi:hypothetical protein